jgi:hypothetical protein
VLTAVMAQLVGLEETDGGGGLDAVAHLFPAPDMLPRLTVRQESSSDSRPRAPACGRSTFIRR